MSAGTVIKIVDLFAGIGGLRQGAEQAVKEAGFTPEIVFTSEIKPDAIKTLTANWPEIETHGDITKISEKEIPSQPPSKRKILDIITPSNSTDETFNSIQFNSKYDQ